MSPRSAATMMLSAALVLLAAGTPGAVPVANARPAMPSVNLAMPAVVASPAVVRAGGTVRVVHVVRNRGARVAGRSRMRLLLSRDREATADDLVVGARTIPSLAPGARSRGHRSFTMPAAVSGGAWFVLACADARRQVRETREADNCGASHVLRVRSQLTPTGSGRSPLDRALPAPMLTRDDARVRQAIATAGSRTYERTNSAGGGQVADIWRLRLSDDGTYRLGTLRWSSLAGERCLTAVRGTWAVAEGYTFAERGGGMLLRAALTTRGQPSSELFTFSNLEPDALWIGESAARFERRPASRVAC